MKKLLTALLVTFIIASCSNPTEPDTEPVFEPYTVGSFMMTSPSTAEYIGIDESPNKVLAKSNLDSTKSDTVIITDPIGYGFELWNDSTYYSEPAVAFAFYDSLVSSQELDHIDIHWTDNTSSALGIRGYNFRTTPVLVSGYFASPCDYPVGSEIKFEYYDTTTSVNVTPIKVAIVKAEGLSDAGKDILGCS